MEEVKPVVTEKDAFDYQDKPLLKALLEKSDQQDSYPSDKISNISTTWFATRRNFSIGTIIEEIKHVFMESSEFWKSR